MADKVGDAFVEMTLRDAKFKTGMVDARTGLQKLAGIAAKASIAIAGVFAFRGVATKIGSFIKKFSDATETASKFATVFESLGDEAEKTATTLAKSFGLASITAKELLGNTGDLLVGFGFTERKALTLARQVNRLAIDLASFTNVEGGAKRASEALTKALLGERESVKLLGIAILEKDVKEQIALDTAKGITFETERQAKAYATLQIATQQSSKAIGDYKRTQGELANTFKRFRETGDKLAISLGRIAAEVLKIGPATTKATKIMDKAADSLDKVEEKDIQKNPFVRMGKALWQLSLPSQLWKTGKALDKIAEEVPFVGKLANGLANVAEHAAMAAEGMAEIADPQAVIDKTKLTEVMGVIKRIEEYRKKVESERAAEEGATAKQQTAEAFKGAMSLQQFRIKGEKEVQQEKMRTIMIGTGFESISRMAQEQAQTGGTPSFWATHARPSIGPMRLGDDPTMKESVKAEKEQVKLLGKVVELLDNPAPVFG